jgi:hypothetical protein
MIVCKNEAEGGNLKGGKGRLTAWKTKSVSGLRSQPSASALGNCSLTFCSEKRGEERLKAGSRKPMKEN